MTDAEVAAAMEIARAGGVRVCAHARSAESVKMCVRHGLGIIYHANFADEEALDLLEANRDWCFVVPALGLTYQACYAAGEWGFTPEMARERGLLHELEVSVDTMGRMRKRGIRVLPGGDYGFAWNPHGTYARDLLLFVDVLGFTPMETLVAATRLGGEIMGRGGRARPGQARLPRRPAARRRRPARRHQAPAEPGRAAGDHEGRPPAQGPGDRLNEGTRMSIAADLLHRHFETLVADNARWQTLIADDLLWELPYAPALGHPAPAIGA